MILSQMEECMMGWMMHGIQHVLLKIEKNPNYKLIYRERQEQEDSQPLKVRLGELFEGLNLQLG